MGNHKWVSTPNICFAMLQLQLRLPLWWLLFQDSRIMSSICFLVPARLNYFWLLVCIFNCRGILIKTLANASQDRKSLSVPQIVFNVIGFCITVATTVLVTLYAKRRLKELQMKEELLLQWSFNCSQLDQALNGNDTLFYAVIDIWSYKNLDLFMGLFIGCSFVKRLNLVTATWETQLRT